MVGQRQFGRVYYIKLFVDGVCKDYFYVQGDVRKANSVMTLRRSRILNYARSQENFWHRGIRVKRCRLQ